MGIAESELNASPFVLSLQREFLSTLSDADQSQVTPDIVPLPVRIGFVHNKEQG